MPSDGTLQTIGEFNFGGPIEYPPRQGTVRPPPHRIIHHRILILDADFQITSDRCDSPHNDSSEVIDRYLSFTPKIDRAFVPGTLHQSPQSVNAISNILKAASRLPSAVNQDVLSTQGPGDETADDTAIGPTHPWAVRVKDSGDFKVQRMLVLVREHQRFRDTLAFVVARPRAEGVDVAEVVLGLRTLLGIPVDFGRTRK
jgi:hypothetical protein